MSVTVTVALNGVPVPLVLDDPVLAAIAEELGHADANDDTWPEWMNVETAAGYLDVSPQRIRKLKERREIPYHQEGPGCRVMFRRTDLDSWMSGFRHPARTTIS